MAAFQWLAEPTAKMITLALVHFLWQGLAVAWLLIALVEICNVRRAAARYVCSLLALLAMFACPIITVVWLNSGKEPFSAEAGTAQPRSVRIIAADVGNHASELDAWLEQGQPFLLSAWLAGVVLLSGRLLAGALGTLQLRRGRQPLPARLKPIARQLVARLRPGRPECVFVSRRVAEAMAVGILRPLVLIPAAWVSEMPLDFLEAVIAHELAHLRRRDLWINLLQRIVESVLFYHPAVWWLSRRLRIERELCADELAVAATGNRLAYAQALEQVACQQTAPVGPLLAAFLRGEKHMQILNRVRHVLRPVKHDRSRLWPAGLIALALPLGLWVASAGLNLASADDEQDRERPVVERERRDREVERRKEIRRDEDGPRKEGPRDGENRKEGPRDGDAPRKPGARDGDVKRSPRDEEVRREATRDGGVRRVIVKDLGDGNKEFEEIIERKIGAKEAAAREKKRIELESDEALTRSKPETEARRIEELTQLVKRLSAQVEKLQDEVSSLRARSATGARDEALREWRTTYDKLEKGQATDREEAAIADKYHRLRGDAEKVIAEKAKIAAERQRAEAEKAAVRAREQAEHAKLEAAEIQELIKRKQAEAKRAAEEAVRKRLELLERETERDIPEEELMRLKKKLRDEQTLLLDRYKEEFKESHKEKPVTRKPLKEKPSEQ